MTYSLTPDRAIAASAMSTHMLIAASDNLEICVEMPQGYESTYNRSRDLVIKLIAIAYDLSIQQGKIIFNGCIQTGESIDYMVRATWGIHPCGIVNGNAHSNCNCLAN